MADRFDHAVNATTGAEAPVWLVTGAGRGVGRALAEMALRRGSRVGVTAHRREDLRSLVEAYGNAVIPFDLDVNDESGARETVERAIELLGRLDVVVNAAGYDTPEFFAGQSPALGHVQTNLFGALWVAQAALDHLRTNVGGKIVQVFGLGSFGADPPRRDYDTARRAVIEFSEQLARDVAPFDVEVTIYVPAEQYSEWIDDNRERSYTLDAFDTTDLKPSPSSETTAPEVPLMKGPRSIGDRAPLRPMVSLFESLPHRRR